MSKRRQALAVSLALWRFADQMDKWEAEGISRDPEKCFGPTRYTFWFNTGPKNFKSTAAIRVLARKIAIGAK